MVVAVPLVWTPAEVAGRGYRTRGTPDLQAPEVAVVKVPERPAALGQKANAMGMAIAAAAGTEAAVVGAMQVPVAEGLGHQMSVTAELQRLEQVASSAAELVGFLAHALVAAESTKTEVPGEVDNMAAVAATARPLLRGWVVKAVALR